MNAPMGRLGITYRDYAAWLLCGVVWHATVTLLVRGDLVQFVPGLVAGLVAGFAAGALTVRSRRRRVGKEHWADLCSTYLAAVVVYACGLAFTEMVVDGWIRGARHRLVDVDLLLGYLAYGLFYATVWAVVLVPMSYYTRRIVWYVHLRGMPRSTA